MIDNLRVVLTEQFSKPKRIANHNRHHHHDHSSNENSVDSNTSSAASSPIDAIIEKVSGRDEYDPFNSYEGASVSAPIPLRGSKGRHVRVRSNSLTEIFDPPSEEVPIESSSFNNVDTTLALGTSYADYGSLLQSRKEHLKLENRRDSLLFSKLKRSRSDSLFEQKPKHETEKNSSSSTVKSNTVSSDNTTATNRHSSSLAHRLSFLQHRQPTTPTAPTTSNEEPISPISPAMRKNEQSKLKDALKRDEKKFWMKDKSVTSCYQCQTPFSFLKRKHHCRICGLIFCWKCSNNFVVAQDYGFYSESGKVRVCGHCLNLITAGASGKSLPTDQSSAPDQHRLSTDNLKKLYTQTNVENFAAFKEPEDVSLSDSMASPTDSSLIVDEQDNCVLIESDDDIVVITAQEKALPDLTASLTIVTAEESPKVNLSTISGEEFEQKFDEHLKSIEDASQHHLRAIVTQMLNDDSVDISWREIIVGLALRVVNSVNPQPSEGDKMDIRHYVKIKRAPGSSKFASEYVDGVVFTKNVIHKKMRKNLENPQLILFSCPIEYHRVENQMSSFDILLDQEEEFLKLMVARIADKKPDLILAQKPVSRIVQDMFVKSNISLIVNVKRSIMERVSRITGYPILSSVDEVDIPRETEGVCKRTCVTRVAGCNSQKTLFTISGDKPEAGCTILLRGDDPVELEKVKKIMRFAVYVAYSLRLEAELFFDSCGTLLQDKRRLSQIENAPDVEPTSVGGTPEERILSVSPHVVIPLRYEEWTDNASDYSDDLEYSKHFTAIDKSAMTTSRMLSPLRHQNIVLLFTKVLKPEFETMRDQNVEYSQQEFGIPEIIVIAYYTENDLTLGRYLETKCFNPSLLKENLHIVRTYTHDTGKLKIIVEKSSNFITTGEEGIAMWSYCKECKRYVTPVVPMSEGTYKYSFGKFLETSLYNDKLTCRTGGCNHSIHRCHIRCFGYKDIVTKIEYEPIAVNRITIPSHQLDYYQEFQKMRFSDYATEVAEACNKFFTELNQCLNEMISNPDYVLLVDQITSMQISVEQQYDALSIAIAETRGSQSMYKLNEMVRNIYVSAKTWNVQIAEFIDQSKITGNLKMLSSITAVSRTKKQDVNKPSLFKRVISANTNTPNRQLTDEAPIIVAFVDNQHLTNSVDQPIKVILLEANSFLPKASTSAKMSHSTSLISISKMASSPSENEFTKPSSIDNGGFITTAIHRSPVSPFDVSETKNLSGSGTQMHHSTSMTSLSTSGERPTLTLAASNKTNGNGKIAPVDIPKPLSNTCVQMFLPVGPSNNSIFVYEDEPSTIIAYALSSADYNLVMNSEGNQGGYESSDQDSDDSDEDERTAVEQHMASKENNHFKLLCNKGTDNLSDSETGNTSARTKARSDFYCTCYFAKQFSALRTAYCNGDAEFIHSLSRCKKFTPTGGKSKSTFTKTWDDRFILKQISRVELLAFLETGPAYFDYMVDALFHGVLSTLCKIVGVYRVGYYHKGKFVKQDVIVMENLFYGRNITKSYDLKGSVRNRFQKAVGAVLLDENLLQDMLAGNPPLITRQLSKTLLTSCIHNDTLFLSKLNVMDYSLLVGIDEESHEIVVGIIDYVRQYTWDKHLETWVKSAGLMSSKNRVPTVISPKNYKKRFREAMDRYFLLIPDKFTGLLNLN